MKVEQGKGQRTGAAQEVRRLVLEGTFSVEELDMASKPTKEAAEPARKKRTVRKKVAKKKAAAAKATGKKKPQVSEEVSNG